MNAMLHWKNWEKSATSLLNSMGAVRDEILLHTTEIKWKNKSYRKINGASVRIFPLQYTGFPALQDTQLIPDNLLNVDFEDIPVRLLQSAENISTSRIIAFLEFILNLSAQTFVKITPMSFVKLSVNTLETCAYGNATGPNPRDWKTKPMSCIAAVDVKTLYPSLCIDTVTKALNCALGKHSAFITKARKIIV